MGAWPTMALAMPGIVGPRQVRPISLPPSSAPAAGSAAKHSAEHRGVIEAALTALS
jgi:2-oxoglutarate dehydrogenase complex dehydrogenase (E1) component-like enzyme